MTDDHRPRPTSGVMGYVAQYQQFDPEATYAGPDGSGDVPSDRYAAAGRRHPGPGRHEAPPATDVDQPLHYGVDGYQPQQYEVDEHEPYADRSATIPHQRAYPDRYGTCPDQGDAYPEPYPPAMNPTAVFPRADERLIDLSVPRPAPVEHRRQGQIRRGLLALAALAVMAAGGTGYVLLRTTGHEKSTAASVRRTAEAPTPTSMVPGEGSAPNGEPVHTVPTSHVAASATTTPPPATVVTTAPTVISVLPLPTVAVPVRTGTPVKTSAPASTIAPAPTGGSASAPAPVTPLTATYSYRTDDGDADPITGYVGTIRVANPGDTAAGSWTVRLTVPSGTTASVETGDVTVSRDGDRLVFRPAAATIAAHGSVTFTFTLSDPLTALPGACTVGDADCD